MASSHAILGRIISMLTISHDLPVSAQCIGLRRVTRYRQQLI